MKSSRLLVYAVLGIIGGLLLENKFLVTKQEVSDGVDKTKDKIKKLGKKK